MPFEELKEQVHHANLLLVSAGLVVLTWGNASGIDRAAGVMAIKPSGIAYDKLRPADMVIVSLETGKVVEGPHRPSSDTPTHLHLYRSFDSIGGIAHTHSLYATIFAQAMSDIPCLGTTHADNFYGTIPATRSMTPAEIATDYELNTGKVIVECFTNRQINPEQVPGVLLASHAPFTWGTTPEKAVENAIVLEFAAQMALQTAAISPSIKPISRELLDKHFLRKHGPKAYYGQK
ncbi:MAG TPA: L-ribulose-5-phosphate 4-epimerase [Tepidisphaeraceae bacterium]|jgi:L-ribulose-5-phosphate 4-epimerase